METPEERFLRFYNSEITYLRESGKIFASTNPKIAKRLDISEYESSDPHTERIIESFAYLTAKLSQINEDFFPEIVNAMLDLLYPHLSNPLPSMSIAKFKYEKSGVISKGTNLLTNTNEGFLCKFKTVYPVNLLPIQMIEAKVTSNYEDPRIKEWMLKLKFKITDKIDNIDFSIFINADKVLSLAIYDCIFCQSEMNPLIRFKNIERKLASDSISAMGFSREEITIPVSKYTTTAYALMQEYFHFPLKFFFINVKNLGQVDDDEFEILIPIAFPERLIGKTLSPNNFLLGCTPIVNLFERTTDPIKLDHKKLSYRLVPDQRYENTTEIYCINDVFETKENKKIEHYFSHTKEADIFWISKRSSAMQRGVPGTDVHLSFLTKENLNDQIVYAKTLCSNRFLASEIQAGTPLSLELGGITSDIVCLTKPVEPTYTPMDSNALWSLISQLSLNHLGLYENTLNSLKKLLTLFAGKKEHRFYEINHLNKIEMKPCVQRIGVEAWRGFVQGIQVDLYLNNPKETGNSGFLLSNVLRHFLALNVNFQSFIKLILIDSNIKTELMKFKPLNGENHLI